MEFLTAVRIEREKNYEKTMKIFVRGFRSHELSRLFTPRFNVLEEI